MYRIAPRAPDGAALPVWLSIRRLAQADRAALAQHLVALPDEDRCARFDGVISDEWVAGHCAALDLAAGGAALGAAAWHGGAIVGAVLAWRSGAGAAEIAVTVAPEHRRRRLASHLIAHVCDAAAREAGATRALFQFRPSNVAVANLVRHLGGVANRVEGRGVVPIGADAR
jgi:ribosomal protein S18 acetylase RimI-like enzyme